MPHRLAVARLAAELAHRFDETVQPSRRARLASRELTSGGVEREAALPHGLGNEPLRLPFTEEAEILELNEHDRWVVVVDEREIDVLWPRAGLLPERVASLGEAGAQAVSLLLVGVVRGLERTDRHGPAGAAGGHDERVGAGDDRGAVVARERLGDERGGEVARQGQRFAVDRSGIPPRPLALGDHELTVVLAHEPVASHVALGQKREECVRAAEAKRREVVAGGRVVAGDELGERLPVEAVAGQHEHGGRIARLDRAHGMLEHVDPGRAAVRVLHQPPQAKTELPGEVDGVVGRK